VDGVRTQGGAHGDILDDLDSGRERSGPQYDGQIVGFFRGVGAGDLGLAAADTFLNHWRGTHHAIQDNGHALDVLPGDLGEFLSPSAVKVYRDVGLVVITDAHPDVVHRVAGEEDFLFQQQRLAFHAAGFPVDGFFVIDLVVCGNIVRQSLVELPGVARLSLPLQGFSINSPG
jgi:hypothetical protein